MLGRTRPLGSQHKLWCFLIGLVLILAPGGAQAARYAALVIEAQSGRVLYAKNADARRHPASLTKMMTLYLLFEALQGGALNLDDDLAVSSRPPRQTPTRLGLRQGEVIRVEDAILALVTKSANDVALVVAEALAGDEKKFARAMTAKARALGMSRTDFRNASGLPHRAQLSTAHDMARLAQALRRDFPQYYGYFARRDFSYRNRTIRSHNNLMRHYPGMDGVKTGYTRASGFNLVSAVERQGRRLIGVVFGGKSARSRDRHMRQLLDLGFQRLGAVPTPHLEKPIAVMFAGRNAKFIDVPLPDSKPEPTAVIAAAGLSSPPR